MCFPFWKTHPLFGQDKNQHPLAEPSKSQSGKTRGVGRADSLLVWFGWSILPRPGKLQCLLFLVMFCWCWGCSSKGFVEDVPFPKNWGLDSLIWPMLVSISWPSFGRFGYVFSIFFHQLVMPDAGSCCGDSASDAEILSWQIQRKGYMIINQSVSR